MTDIYLSVDTPNDVIEKEILKLLAKVLNDAIRDASPSIKNRMGTLVRTYIEQTPEYESIMNDKLKIDFGLISPGSILPPIVEKIVEGITLTPIPIIISGNQLEGGLLIEWIKSDYSDILGMDEASYKSTSVLHGTEYEIPWLKWLLKEGDSLILVHDYRVYYSTKPQSRSGGGIMIKDKNIKGFQMDKRYSGVPQNNFLTRAFLDNTHTENAVMQILKEEITARIK